MRLLTLHDLTNVTSLYSLQMRYLLSTQQQFSRGLEGMIDAASDQALKDAFRSHLHEVSLQCERIDQILIELTSKADDAKCAITSSLIASVEKIVRETDRGAVRDAWLVAGARKIESFEIASYHAALQWASLLSFAYHVSLLQETLDEEVRADGKLHDIERRINLAAMAV
jgi:ferritin-like metal-binding protein YciE